MAHVRSLARAPHPVGTREHRRVREYLVASLRGLGLEVHRQRDTLLRRRRGTLLRVPVENLLVRLPGTDPTGGVLLSAHYDTKRLTPGAGDDAAGVATLLETLRALTRASPLRNDVLVLISDGEELGLQGARTFVHRHPWADDVSVVVNFEARGSAGPSLMFETGPRNGWVVGHFAAASPRPVSSSLHYEVYRRLPNDTDYTIFRRRGVPGLNFAFAEGAETYHTPLDTPGRLSAGSLQHHGMQALAMTRRLAEAELGEPHAPDRVFFSLPAVGVVHYPTSAALPLAVGLAVLAVVLLMTLVVTGRVTGRGLLAGMLAAVAAVALAAGGGYLVRAVARGLHPEVGRLGAKTVYVEWPYLSALALGATGATAALYGLLRRWFTLEGLALGALAPLLAGAVWTAYAAPGTSFLLLWPGTLAVAGVAAAGLTGDVGAPVRAALPLAAAVPVVVLLAPLLRGLTAALSLSAGPLLAGLCAVFLLYLVPVVDLVGRPRRWGLPAVALLMAAGLTGAGFLWAAPSAERPLPVSLAYRAELGRGTARWLTADRRRGSWLRSFVADDADSVRLRASVYAPAGDRRAYWWSPAPALPARPVEGRRLGVSPGPEGGVRLELRFPPGDAYRRVRVRGGRGRIASVDGRPAEEIPGGTGGPSELLDLATSGNTLRLTVSGLPRGAVQLEVLRYRHGLPALEGAPSPRRPPDRTGTRLVAGRRTLSDLTILRETVTF